MQINEPSNRCFTSYAIMKPSLFNDGEVMTLIMLDRFWEISNLSTLLAQVLISSTLLQQLDFDHSKDLFGLEVDLHPRFNFLFYPNNLIFNFFITAIPPFSWSFALNLFIHIWKTIISFLGLKLLMALKSTNIWGELIFVTANLNRGLDELQFFFKKMLDKFLQKWMVERLLIFAYFFWSLIISLEHVYSNLSVCNNK